MTKHDTPKRGEIWLVNFDPRVGDEITKIRPAVVVNSDGIGFLRLRIVVPITTWKQKFGASAQWIVPLPADNRTGLVKESGADTFQVKSISVDRFVSRKGSVNARELEAIVAGVAMCVGYS